MIIFPILNSDLTADRMIVVCVCFTVFYCVCFTPFFEQYHPFFNHFSVITRNHKRNQFSHINTAVIRLFIRNVDVIRFWDVNLP